MQLVFRHDFFARKILTVVSTRVDWYFARIPNSIDEVAMHSIQVSGLRNCDLPLLRLLLINWPADRSILILRNAYTCVAFKRMRVGFLKYGIYKRWEIHIVTCGKIDLLRFASHEYVYTQCVLENFYLKFYCKLCRSSKTGLIDIFSTSIFFFIRKLR